MKKNTIIIAYIILICLTLKFTYNTLANSIFLNNYQNGQYSEKQAKTFTHIIFLERYIAYYNYGNVLYQNGEYEKAIEEYKKALNEHVPKYKECNIRINYALAICKTVKVDEKDQNSIDNAIKRYEEAIDVLTEDGCANKNDSNGHSQKAEQLKKDIQKEIDRLKNLKNSDENKDPDQDQDKKNPEKDNAETIEEKMKKAKEDATEAERTADQTFSYRDYKDFNMFEGKGW